MLPVVTVTPAKYKTGEKTVRKDERGKYQWPPPVKALLYYLTDQKFDSLDAILRLKIVSLIFLSSILDDTWTVKLMLLKYRNKQIQRSEHV